MNNLISLDFETGSTKHWECAITQVGVARFVGGTLLESWREIIKPAFGTITPEALEVQNTTYAELEKKGKPVVQVAARLSNLLYDAGRQSDSLGELIVCGHNFYDFDQQVLARLWDKAGNDVLPFSPVRVFDTMEATRMLMAIDAIPPGAWNLAAICHWYGIDLKNPHNPECDAIATGHLALKLREEVRRCQ